MHKGNGDDCCANTWLAVRVLQSSAKLRRIRLLGLSVLAAAVAALLLAASPAWAQDPSPPDFSRLNEQLKTGDGVLVSIQGGTMVRGRVVDISNVQITVLANDVRREIPADQVTRVQRRRNGILLGALIGAGAGIPFGIALRSYAYNEGGNEAGALLFPIAVGLGTGVAIDALLVRPRTVFERTPSTRAQLSVIVGPGRAVARMVISY